MRKTVGDGDSGPFSLRQPADAKIRTTKETHTNPRRCFPDMLIVPRWRKAVICCPADNQAFSAEDVGGRHSSRQFEPPRLC